MADFSDFDAETLERLRKALDKAVETGQGRQPWQELFDRETSAFSEGVLSNDIIQGLSGSWAASYNFAWGAGTTTDTVPTQAADPNIPAPLRARTSKFGRRGVPDIDFVPYNWRTNRFSIKGPALVGNPISFEPFGPTLKSEGMDWTWEIVPGAGPNGGDLLTQTDRPDGASPAAISIEQIYNTGPWVIGGAGEPNGGLYLIFSDPGEFDGALPGGASAPLDPLPAYFDVARVEIFRVSEMLNDVASGRAQIELHPSKPVGNYFDLPAARSVRAVTLFQPYASRLAAIPESGAGVGRERVFQVVSPVRAAASDYYPPYDGGTLGDGTWLQGGFPSHPAGWDPGTAATWMGKAVLPCPLPLRETQGTVEKLAPFTISSAEAGTSKIFNVADVDPTDVGRVIRIYHVDSDDGDPFNTGDVTKILGWFEVLAIDADIYTIRHVPDIPPLTGQVFHGQVTHANVGTPFIHVRFTVHDPVSEIFQGDFDHDKVEACRLKHLIDPHLVERFGKKRVAQSPALSAGFNPGRGDRAAFGTVSITSGPAPGQVENPGNLLDLGFRMVLFPAKDDGSGNPIPDFDKPIDSLEAVIDPDITEQQFLEIDYSAGVVTLSHPPPDAPRVGGLGQIIPNGIIGGVGTTNPREEAVLFASCVPYSREPQSNAPGIRAIVRNPDGNNEHVDVFSNRITAQIDLLATTFIAAAPWIDEATGIVLTGTWGGPQTGIIDIIDGDIGDVSIGTWAYTQVDSAGPGVDTLRLVSSMSGAADPSAFGPRMTVVLRREARTSINLTPDNSFDVDDYRFDTTYGSTARFNTMRFGSTATPYIDGSVLITSGGGGAGLAEGFPQYYIDQAASSDSSPIFTDIVGAFAAIGALPVLPGPVHPIENTLALPGFTDMGSFTTGVYSLINTNLKGTGLPGGFFGGDNPFVFASGGVAVLEDIRSFKGITIGKFGFHAAPTFTFPSNDYVVWDDVATSSPTNGPPGAAPFDASGFSHRLRATKTFMDAATWDVGGSLEIELENDNQIAPGAIGGGGFCLIKIKGSGNHVNTAQSVGTLDIDIGDAFASGGAKFSGAEAVTFGAGPLTWSGVGTWQLQPGGAIVGSPPPVPGASPLVSAARPMRGIVRGIHVQTGTASPPGDFDVWILESGVIKYLEGPFDSGLAAGFGTYLSTTFGEIVGTGFGGAPMAVWIDVNPSHSGAGGWDFINVTFFVK